MAKSASVVDIIDISGSDANYNILLLSASTGQIVASGDVITPFTYNPYTGRLAVNEISAAFYITTSAVTATQFIGDLIGTASFVEASAIGGQVASSSISEHAISADTSSFTEFNGSRPIKRTGYVGVNVGGGDVVSFLNNFFFPFVPATIAISPAGTTYYQQGTAPNFTVTTTITANDVVTFGSASVKRDGNVWNTSTLPPLSFGFSDTAITSNHSYISYAQIDNNGTPAIITSNTSTAAFIYPYLWGMSVTPGLSDNALYSAFTKQVVVNGNKTVSLIGNVTYIYFAYPATYAALSSILDPNGFEVIGNFEHSSSVSVASNGLNTDWTANYRVYRSRLVSDPNGSYQFKL
jgi:hypothetical protein